MPLVPFIPELHLEDFSGSAINIANLYNKNCVPGQYQNGRPYITQRPSIDLFLDASLGGASALGRGSYYWGDADARYIVNGAKIYSSDYSTELDVWDDAAKTSADSITSSTGRVYFIEMKNHLLILDPDNNEGWYILLSDPTNVILMTDAVFAGIANGNPATGTLSSGGAYLNGKAYIITTDAKIYNCDTEDPLTWSATAFITAQRESDGGVSLVKHHDHLVAFGTRTIEFFYDAGNSSASPLSRRSDIYHSIGLLSGDTIFMEDDVIYGIGSHRTGGLFPFRMVNMKIEPVGSDTLSSFLTNARITESLNILGSGFTASRKTYYVITLYRIQTVIVPQLTLVMTGSGWGEWETETGGLTNFPLVDWNLRTGETPRSGEGIMTNGDMVTIQDNLVPTDTLVATGYFVDATVLDGYVVETGAEGNNIEMIVRTGLIDYDTTKWKNDTAVEIVADKTSTSQTATLKWSNENSDSWNTGRSVETSKRRILKAMGRFQRRNYELTYSGGEQYRVEGLDTTPRGG